MISVTAPALPLLMLYRIYILRSNDEKSLAESYSKAFFIQILQCQSVPLAAAFCLSMTDTLLYFLLPVTAGISSRCNRVIL